jgi:O-antigen/teichoic acid export membrane protein
MKNKILITVVSFIAILICLIITILLYYSVPPESLIIMSFVVGIVTGVCILAMIINLRNHIREKRLKDSKMIRKNQDQSK